MKDTRVYTVTELTKGIRLLLEGAFPEIWVEGEVSNYTASHSGHVYFNLKDENSVINCVFFKGSQRRVNFTIGDGMHVLCFGRVSVYDKRGQYQLYVSDMELRGQGALELAFKQLKEKLYKEGLFDENKKKKLPHLPVHIAVITSPTGAAVRDILKIAHRRFAGLKISIYPVRVQGDEAKNDIARAIEALNEFNRYAASSGGKYEAVDVIILGRGGGSLEDLWPFNEEIVARAIYASAIPIVSAVGHEIDYTISDFVADLRAPTPSAAAELVVPLKEDLLSRVRNLRKELDASMKDKVGDLEQSVNSLKNSYILRSPMNFLAQMRQRIDDSLKAAVSGMRHVLELCQKDLSVSEGKLSMLSPMAVLERGYSITFKNGKVVRTAGALARGDIICTTFREGGAESRVEKVN